MTEQHNSGSAATPDEPEDGLSAHHAAERSAGAITLNTITGNVEASLDLILPMSTDEHIAVIAALASDLAVALGKLHGGQHIAAEHLRGRLRYLAGHPPITDSSKPRRPVR